MLSEIGLEIDVTHRGHLCPFKLFLCYEEKRDPCNPYGWTDSKRTFVCLYLPTSGEVSKCSLGRQVLASCSVWRTWTDPDVGGYRRSCVHLHLATHSDTLQSIWTNGRNWCLSPHAIIHWVFLYTFYYIYMFIPYTKSGRDMEKDYIFHNLKLYWRISK